MMLEESRLKFYRDTLSIRPKLPKFALTDEYIHYDTMRAHLLAYIITEY